MKNPQKFERCLMLSGGGSRFAYYLGIHAAADACGQAPDLLLASCGGAIAGAIIQGLPDSEARKRWMASRQMYDYLHSVRMAPHNRLYSQLFRALARYLAGYVGRGRGATIPDLYADYLADLPPTIPLPSALPDGPTLAVVAGRLLYAQHEVGAPRHGRPLFSEVLMGSERTRALLAGIPSPVSGDHLGGSAVAPMLEVMTDVPVIDAVRLSLADIFYIPCQPYGAHHYCGGVIDLYPLELAKALAHQVAMEFKPPFNPHLAAPAIRSVFGIDCNARLRQVHAQLTDVRIDTSDMERAIASSVSKHAQWRDNRIALRMPSYTEYVAIIDAQWQYGFARGMEGYGRRHTHAVRPRVCDHNNWSEG